MSDIDVLVLGAGAAGLFCAGVAARRGLRVMVLDHSPDPGEKIRISGGGRCNFTNVDAGLPERYQSSDRGFARHALRAYPPAEFIALVRAHRIAFHEKHRGQLFCDGSARQIVAMLREECEAGGVSLALGQPVGAVAHHDGLFEVSIGSRRVTAPALVLATGGPAIPKLGATDFAYGVARQFGLKLVQPRPALVPLTLLFFGESGLADRAGVLVAALLLYSVLWVLLVAAVSSVCRSSQAALAVLICLWLGGGVLLPRAAAGFAAAAHPLPDKSEFNARLGEEIAKLGDSHNDKDPAFIALKEETLRKHGVSRVEDVG